MKRISLAVVILAALIAGIGAKAFPMSLSVDAGYHFQDGASGAAIALFYTHHVEQWFELGGEAQYWGQIGEKEIDSWDVPDPAHDAVHKFRKFRREGAGYFGPLVAFPLSWRKDRKFLAVPTLSVGVEMSADREWVEETIDRGHAGDTEQIRDEKDIDEFGWYVRPGFTFYVAWARFSYQHLFSQDGAAQFQVLIGFDLLRLIGVYK